MGMSTAVGLASQASPLYVSPTVVGERKLRDMQLCQWKGEKRVIGRGLSGHSNPGQVGLRVPHLNHHTTEAIKPHVYTS